MKKKVQPKALKVEVIQRELEKGGTHPAYLMLDEFIINHHDHLVEAKIVLAWNSAWNADDDSRIVSGASASTIWRNSARSFPGMANGSRTYRSL